LGRRRGAGGGRSAVPDGFRLTNLITCRDLTRCAAGQGKYAPVIAPDGGIVNDPVLLRRDENTFWLCLADSDAYLYAMGLAQGRGLNATDLAARGLPTAGAGPKAKDLMRELVGEAISGVKYYWTLDAAIAASRSCQPHRLDRRGRVRGLSRRSHPRRRIVGDDHGSGSAAQHPADRSVRGAPD
jgi:glycine cleavage system aminomethyltransferase T